MSHTISIDLSTLSASTITELVNAGALNAAQVTALVSQGLITLDAPAPDKGKGKAKTVKVVGTDVVLETVEDVAAEGWANIAGYTCGSKRMARYSSEVIIRHLEGTCNCLQGPNDSWKCKAVNKYGYAVETRGSQPNIAMPTHLLA